MAVAGERPLDLIPGERCHPQASLHFEISQLITRLGQSLEARDFERCFFTVQDSKQRYGAMMTVSSKEQNNLTRDARFAPSGPHGDVERKLLMDRRHMLLIMTQRAEAWCDKNIALYEKQKHDLELATAQGDLPKIKEHLAAWSFAKRDKVYETAEKTMPRLKVAYEFLLHEASTKMYRRLKIAVDDSPLPRTNPDWIRLNEMVTAHDHAIKSMRKGIATNDIGKLREAIAVVYLDSKTAEFEAGRRQLAEWEKMYSQFMPEIKSALERRNIRELDVAIQRLPLMDESILSAQHTFTQWTYERKALLTDLQAAVDAMDGPKLKGLLGEEGWTFEDEEDIVEEAREKFEWCVKLKKDLRAMMGKKQIVAMREFLDVWPFTTDDPDVVGARTLLEGLEGQVARIPQTTEGTVLKQVYTGLGGAWKNTDAPAVLKLRATVEKFDALTAKGQEIIRKKQEKEAITFLEEWPFATQDPIAEEMRTFLLACERRRERQQAAVKASLEKRSVKDLQTDLQALRDSGGDDPVAAEQLAQWQAKLAEAEPVIRTAVESADIERIEAALKTVDFSSPYIDQARERLRILVEQVSKKAEKTAAAWMAPEYSISEPSYMGDAPDPDRDP
jgi:hypothetical protein